MKFPYFTLYRLSLTLLKTMIKKFLEKFRACIQSRRTYFGKFVNNRIPTCLCGIITMNMGNYISFLKSLTLWPKVLKESWTLISNLPNKWKSYRNFKNMLFHLCKITKKILSKWKNKQWALCKVLNWVMPN